MDALEYLKEQDGLLLFFGILVFGLPVLLPAVHLSLTGELAAPRLVGIALAAMLVSDAVWYGVGWGAKLGALRRRSLRARLEAGRGLLLRSSVPPLGLLFLSRFLYGTRIAIQVAAGLARVDPLRVIACNALSAGLWILLLFVSTRVAGVPLEESFGRAVGLLGTFAASLALLWVLRKRVRIRVDGPTQEMSEALPISVILPARDEEGYLETAIRSVRRQSIPAEVIVVENGSRDGTARIARRLADRVVQSEWPLSFGRARNLGAREARGRLLVFLDADSRMEPGALEEISRHTPPGGFGTVLGRPDPPRLRYRLFLGLKNLGHRLAFYRGVLGGLGFCDAALFRAVGGYDEELAIDELHDFSRRARRAGGRYVLVTAARATTSMRRFERAGLWSSFLFWCRVRFGLGHDRSFRRLVAAYAEPDRRNARRPSRAPALDVTPSEDPVPADARRDLGRP